MKFYLMISLFLLMSITAYSAKVLGIKMAQIDLGGTPYVIADDLISNGPAHLAGMQPGDWITAVNEKSTSGMTKQDVTKLIASLADNGKAALKINRLGKIITLKMSYADSDDLDRVFLLEGEPMEDLGFFISPSFAVDYTSPELKTSSQAIQVSKDKKKLTIEETISDNLSKKLHGKLAVHHRQTELASLSFILFKNQNYQNYFSEKKKLISHQFDGKKNVFSIRTDLLKIKPENMQFSFELLDDAGNRSLYVYDMNQQRFTTIERVTNDSSGSEESSSEPALNNKETPITNIDVHGLVIPARVDSLYFYNDRLQNFYNTAPFRLKKNGYDLSVASNEYISLDEQGFVKMVSVSSGSFYRNITLKPGSSVYMNDGHLLNFKPLENAILDGCTIMKNREAWLYENGKVKSYTTSIATNINRLPIRKGDLVIINTNGTVSMTVKEERTVSGHGDTTTITSSYRFIDISGMKLYGNLIFWDVPWQHQEEIITAYPNGQLKNGTLAKPYTNKGIIYTGMISYFPDGSLELGTVQNQYHFMNRYFTGTIRFYPNGMIKSGVITGEDPSVSIKCLSNSYLYIYSNGNLASFTSPEKSTYYGFEIQDNSTVECYPDGKPKSISLARDTIINGIKVKKNFQVKLYPNLNLKQFVPADGLVFDGKVFSRYYPCYLYQNGKIASYSPLKPVEVTLKDRRQKITLRETVVYDFDGNVAGGILDTNTTINGQEFQGGVFIQIARDGSVNTDYLDIEQFIDREQK